MTERLAYHRGVMPTENRHIIRRGLDILRMSIRLQPRAFSIGLAGPPALRGHDGGRGDCPRSRDRPGHRALDSARFNLDRRLVGAVAAIMGVVSSEGDRHSGRAVPVRSQPHKLQAHFRRRVTEQYQRLSLEWHRKHSTGSLLSNANSDVEAMFWFIAPLPLSCGVLFMVLITFVMLATTDLVLTLIGALLIPTIAILSHFYNMRGERSRDVLPGDEGPGLRCRSREL